MFVAELSCSCVRVFIVRQHAHHTERDIVLQTLFIAGGRGINLVFRAPPPSQNSNWNLFSGSANARGWKTLRFSTEIAVYLGNGMIQADDYYRLL